MSAPMSHDPLVVTTKDGVTWVRRAVTQDGHGLYAVTDSCTCPEYLMASLAKLAEHGIAGSAHALPVPVGPEPSGLTSEREQVIGALDLLAMMPEKSAAVVSGHLAALLAEVRGLRARVSELEAQRERRRVRLVALQNDALSMRGSLSPMGEDRKVPFPLGETLTPAVDWLIARVTELEVTRSAVFLARRDSQVLGLYEQSEDALHHCEDALGRTDGYGSFPFSWRERPDGSRELFVWTYREVESGTGFTVVRLELRDEFDEGWGADADGEVAPAEADELTRTFLPVASLREEPHDSLLHHDMPEPAHPVPCRFPKSPGCTCGLTGADIEPETGGGS